MAGEAVAKESMTRAIREGKPKRMPQEFLEGYGQALLEKQA